MVFLGLVDVHLVGVTLLSEDQYLLVLHDLFTEMIVKDSLDVILNLSLWLAVYISFLKTHA